MRARSASSIDWVRRLRALGALAMAVVLAAACTGALPAANSPGAIPTASPTPGLSAPSPASPPEATASGATTPSSTPPLSPGASTAAPTSTVPHWDALGTVGAGDIDVVAAVGVANDRVLFLATIYRNDAWVPYASVWDPRTGQVREVASLDKERSEFNAVGLDDGRALVIGGTNDAYQSYSSTYLFDVASGAWTKSGLLHQARSAPCAAVLADGRVLVAGGYFHVRPDNGAVVPDAALAVAVGGGVPEAQPPLGDVEPPFAGAALATAELFDPATGAWSRTGAMRFARSGCQAVTLRDGRVLVVGSEGTEGAVAVDKRAFTSAEIYDPATGRFSPAGSLPPVDAQAYPKLHEEEDSAWPGTVGSLAALDDGGAILVGHEVWWKHMGNMTRSFRLDAGKGTWTEIGTTFGVLGNPGGGSPIFLTTGIRDLAGAQVATLPDGRVLVAGGSSAYVWSSDQSVEQGSRVVAASLAYDPKTNRWPTLPSMPGARARGTTVTLSDGTVVVAGGWDAEGPLPSIVRLTPGP